MYLFNLVRDWYTNATRANERTTSMTADIACIAIVSGNVGPLPFNSRVIITINLLVRLPGLTSFRLQALRDAFDFNIQGTNTAIGI
jgi:hypothetical protein